MDLPSIAGDVIVEMRSVLHAHMRNSKRRINCLANVGHCLTDRAGVLLDPRDRRFALLLSAESEAHRTHDLSSPEAPKCSPISNPSYALSYYDCVCTCLSMALQACRAMVMSGVRTCGRFTKDDSSFSRTPGESSVTFNMQ